MKLKAPPFLKGPFVRSDTILSSASEVCEDAPSITGSDVSSLDYESDDNNSFFSLSSPASASPRVPLQWEFKGLTVWLEFEEFDSDLKNAIDYAAKIYGTEKIPVPHAPAIYGMTHLTKDSAIDKLAQVPQVLAGWTNVLDPPMGVTCDIAEEGKPGQVCDIAWVELTFTTNEHHEAAMDSLYELFEMPSARQGHWRPHISLAYDNVEDPALNIQDTFAYVSRNPSLLKQRRIKAVSLWSTAGKMADWYCLDRVNLPQKGGDEN